MTRSQQLRLARPVAFVYWLLVLGGLLVFTAGRLDHVERLTPLWIGAVVGTALGQVFALRNMRLWLALGIMVGLAYFSTPLVTGSARIDAVALWKVLAPALLCGYWSLGDRALATAFWFPAVLWMLSILDRAAGTARQLVPDATGGALLVALALAFFLFLRVRESRRVALWSRIAAQPIAPSRPVTTLRQRPAHHALRAGWGLALTATTAVVTAGLAPRLWQLESLRGEQQRVAHDTVEVGLPCCPSSRLAEARRARVKEYLDIGLGHDEDMLAADAGAPACEICPVEVASAVEAGDRAIVKLRAYADLTDAIPVPVDSAAPVGALSGGSLDAAPGVGFTVPTAPGVPSPSVDIAAPALAAPAPLPVPPAPDAPIAQAPAPAPVSPVAAPAPAAHPPRISAQSNSPTAEPRTGTTGVRRASSTSPALWPWLAVITIAALVMQLIALGLRPLRRLLLLRHLRSPFWSETIDQRISNAWQLALIGLGDAGWRPDATEAPRELAARTGITGIEQCAIILERARHGLGLDAGDLTDMLASADTAYASARAKLGPLPRALSWLRAPLT